MTPKTQNAIVLFCYATVSHMFATMHNPRMRGDKFEWEMFPDMMENHCRETLGFNPFVSCPKKHKKECEDHAATTGRMIAVDLVKWMTE